jgi:RNA-directed DNA polymerase
MQELFALGLRPIAETVSDHHSYGFREKRSLHDAIKMTHITLSKKVSAQWILEADIKSCFDRISHDWLLAHIPLPRTILGQWLRAGYMESSTLYPTDEGTPQGGIISPLLCNMTLDGLETLVQKGRNKKRRKLNVIRYADDFIVTGATPEILLHEIKPDLDRFLAARGLELSAEKTRLSHIDDGFDFLGCNVRKFNNRLLIQPAEGKPRALLDKVRACLRQYRGAPFHVLLLRVNRILRGWAFAYRRVVAKARLSYIDKQVFHLVRQWLHREHPSRSWGWLARRFRQRIHGRVDFCACYRGRQGASRIVQLFRAADVPIRYHVKIRSVAHPYDPAFQAYFVQRNIHRKMAALADRIHLNSSSLQKLAG